MNLLKYETYLMNRNYRVICGVDEAGYGASAGDLVACAIAMRKEDYLDVVKIHWKKHFINDSKQVPKLARENMYAMILDTCYAVGIGRVDVSEINHMRNIRKAGLLARYRAVTNLARSDRHDHMGWHAKDQNIEYAKKFNIPYKSVTPSYILVDGDTGMPEIKNIPVKSIVDGDAKSITIAAASIIAKVYRDRHMMDLDDLYPQYGFKSNAGYAVKYHRAALKKHGVTPYHREYFKDVKESIQGELF